ncbi:MAG TPA: T9SS type A sorting domain-containing protein [Candidatus Acidoferrales bacterium]|nr:T9SS type A sorting domain-containing protein [Candidatus Acidoferrales bacterium]
MVKDRAASYRIVLADVKVFRPLRAIVFTLLLAASMSFAQTNWYVSATGSDISGNGSSDNPWKTIPYAINASANGDVIDVKAGVYAGTDITINKSLTLVGQSGAMISVPNNSTVNGFDITTNDVTIQGFEIAGPVSSSYTTYSWGSNISRGIAVSQGVTGFTITNNNIHDVRNGILVDGRNNTGSITGNRIENTKSGISVQYTDGSGITIASNTQGQYGNEWGLNLHLNGYWDGTTTHANPYPGGAAPTGVQQALLGNSSSNSGWTVQDQAYVTCNRTQVQVATSGSAGAQGSLLTPLNAIQAGIDAVTSNGTVNIAAGTYVQSGRLTVNKSLTILGAGESITTIDASASKTDWGILVSSSDVVLSNFTIIPPFVSGKSGTSAGGGYAIHVSNAPSIISDITISHITVQNGNRSGVDLNGVDNATISYVTTQNAAYGNGMSLSGVHGASVSHITTGGNAWGGMAVYCSGSTQANRGSDNINIDGSTCTITEPNKIYAQDEFGLTNTNININGYDYFVKNNLYSGYTWYSDSLAHAVTIATTYADLALSGSDTASYIRQISTGSFQVGSGMKIQTAVNAATDGDTVHITAGTFDETFNINKRVSLLGAGSGGDGTLLKNTGAQTDFTKLPDVAGVTYGTGYRPNIILSASGTDSNDPVLIKDLQINPGPNIGYPRPGIILQPGTAAADYVASYSYVELDNVRIIGNVSGDTPGQANPHVSPSSSNEWGVAIDGATSLTHFVVNNCEFRDMTYGMVFFNDATNPSTVQYMQMNNTTFDSNSVKGFYTEKLSDAIFTNVTVSNNGNIARSPYYWAWNNAGIDVTLKYGSYENLVFNNLTVTGNGIGSYAGAGLSVKARGTGTDAISPSATLDGVTVNGGTFTGNTVGIRFGEVANPPAPNYWDPPAQSLLNTSPVNIEVSNAAIYTNTQSGLSNVLSGVTVNAIGNWFGSADGPYNAATNFSASGDMVSDGINYSPWWDKNYAGDPHTSAWVWSTNSDIDSAVNALSSGDTLNVMAGIHSGKFHASKNVIVKFATPPVFDSISVDSGGLVLSSNLTVSGNLNLTNGNIVIGDSSKIVFDTSAQNPNETSSGKIIGTVEVAPRDIGTDSLHLLGLLIQPGSDNLGNVGFTRKTGSGGIVTSGGDSGIATTWQITVDHQPASGRTVTFSWLRDFDNGVDTNHVIVYRNEGSGWQAYAGPFSVSGDPRQITLNVNGFSDWTMGSSGDHSLYVQVTSFVAKADYDKVTLTWGTQSEVDNAGFNILRSDGFRSVPTDSASTLFELIGGYIGNDNLKGLGTSTSGRAYSFTDAKIQSGMTYEYKIQSVSINGTTKDLNTLWVTVDVPKDYALYQNYPNPFNPSTAIRFDLKEASMVTLDIYNTLGQKILENNYGNMSPGRYNEGVNMDKFASGVYFYRIKATGDDGQKFVSTKKLVLMK